MNQILYVTQGVSFLSPDAAAAPAPRQKHPHLPRQSPLHVLGAAPAVFHAPAPAAPEASGGHGGRAGLSRAARATAAPAAEQGGRQEGQEEVQVIGRRVGVFKAQQDGTSGKKRAGRARARLVQCGQFVSVGKLPMVTWIFGKVICPVFQPIFLSASWGISLVNQILCPKFSTGFGSCCFLRVPIS